MPLTQRLFCVTSISDSPNESLVLKKGKKNGTVVSADCPSRTQSVCSLRCGMKLQKNPKECELSFCRLPTAAVAHRPFIAWQQGKPPYHNKMEMRRKTEQRKAAEFLVVFFVISQSGVKNRNKEDNLIKYLMKGQK